MWQLKNNKQYVLYLTSDNSILTYSLQSSRSMSRLLNVKAWNTSTKAGMIVSIRVSPAHESTSFSYTMVTTPPQISRSSIQYQQEFYNINWLGICKGNSACCLHFLNTSGWKKSEGSVHAQCHRLALEWRAYESNKFPIKMRNEHITGCWSLMAIGSKNFTCKFIYVLNKYKHVAKPHEYIQFKHTWHTSWSWKRIGWSVAVQIPKCLT